MKRVSLQPVYNRLDEYLEKIANACRDRDDNEYNVLVVQYLGYIQALRDLQILSRSEYLKLVMKGGEEDEEDDILVI